MTRFTENQSFRQPWLVVVLALVFVGPMVAFWLFLSAGLSWGDNPSWDLALLTYVAVDFAFVVWMLNVRMETRVEDREVIVKFHWLWPEKTFAMDNIVEAKARNYRPIREYGGWGVRWGGGGRAFNVSGNRGVELALTDGRRVMIGSQSPDELERALAEGMAAAGHSV